MSMSETTSPSGSLPPVASLPVVAQSAPVKASSGVEATQIKATTRRDMLKKGAFAAVALAAANAVTMVVRPGVANAVPPYTTKPGLTTSAVGSPCLSDQGCVGPPADLIDQGYCATDADWAASPALNWNRYMYTGVRGSWPNQLRYRDMSSNICHGGYDAWNHDATPCGFCPSSLWMRCHDGWKQQQNGLTWGTSEFTICHGIARCNGVSMGGNCGSTC